MAANAPLSGMEAMTVREVEKRGRAEAERYRREKPSKRLGSPPVGDMPADWQKTAEFFDAMAVTRTKCQRQRLELRRLNRVIQQMSWKLHVKRRDDVTTILILRGVVVVLVMFGVLAWVHSS